MQRLDNGSDNTAKSAHISRCGRHQSVGTGPWQDHNVKVEMGMRECQLVTYIYPVYTFPISNVWKLEFGE